MCRTRQKTATYLITRKPICFRLIVRYAQARTMSNVIGFPRVVNEKAARTVAGTVAVVALVAAATGELWPAIPLAYGFVARALTGPKLSPLGLLATRVIAPRLGPPKDVPGPPKRFAQGMGAAITTAAAVLGVGLGFDTAATVLLVMIVVAATLESVFALCIGCQIFAWLMRAGVIPATVCEECANIWARQRPQSA